MKRTRTPLRAVTLAFALLSTDALAGSTANELQLLTGYAAQEACSCAFVVGQTDAYCQAYGQQPGFITKIAIDHAAMTVTATYAPYTRTSTFAAGKGCTLAPL
ncbi:MAG TPA: hypothetical protein VGI39_17605 [Polyangiaceae bacterium]|jgi:hypothetical protein